MKKLLIGLAILILLLVGGWYWGENWMARRMNEAIAESPEVTGTVTAMHRPGRLGVQIGGLDIGTPDKGASLPELDAYLSLRAPTTLKVDFPSQMVVRPADQPAMDIAMTDGQFQIGIAPSRGMNVNHTGLSLDDLVLNDAPAADSVEISARLAHMGGVAPAGSAASYRLDLAASGLMVPSLPETLDINGSAQVWLDQIPGLATMQQGAMPNLTGLQSRGINVSLGELGLRIAGRVEADAQGFASGQAAIYTEDGPGFVDAAANAGLLPPAVAVPVRALVMRLAGRDGRAPDDSDPATDSPLDAQQVVAEAEAEALQNELVTLPPAGQGEIRLPIFLSDGVMRIGPVPIGPAPMMPRM